MPNTILGKVCITPKGAYDSGATYAKLDAVYDDASNASYLSLKDGNTATLANDGVNWVYLCRGIGTTTDNNFTDAYKAMVDSAVQNSRMIAGNALSDDITLAQLIAAGLASGDASGSAQNALKLGGVDAANFPQISSGTWTPTLFGTTTAGSPTYSEALGVWYKIGKLVIILFILKLSAKGGMAGNVTVGGLPFVPNQYGAGHCTFGGYSGITLAGSTVLVASPVDPNGIQMLDAGNTGSSLVDASMLGDSFSMWDSGAGFYMTDQ